MKTILSLLLILTTLNVFAEQAKPTSSRFEISAEEFDARDRIEVLKRRNEDLSLVIAKGLYMAKKEGYLQILKAGWAHRYTKEGRLLVGASAAGLLVSIVGRGFSKGNKRALFGGMGWGAGLVGASIGVGTSAGIDLNLNQITQSASGLNMDLLSGEELKTLLEKTDDEMVRNEAEIARLEAGLKK